VPEAMVIKLDMVGHPWTCSLTITLTTPVNTTHKFTAALLAEVKVR